MKPTTALHVADPRGRPGRRAQPARRTGEAAPRPPRRRSEREDERQPPDPRHLMASSTGPFQEGTDLDGPAEPDVGSPERARRTRPVTTIAISAIDVSWLPVRPKSRAGSVRRKSVKTRLPAYQSVNKAIEDPTARGRRANRSNTISNAVVSSMS